MKKFIFVASSYDEDITWVDYCYGEDLENAIFNYMCSDFDGAVKRTFNTCIPNKRIPLDSFKKFMWDSNFSITVEEDEKINIIMTSIGNSLKEEYKPAYYNTAKDYAIESYGVYSTDEDEEQEEMFLCPECGEPLSFEDYKDYDFNSGCPICGFDILEVVK